jgi:hypothetical protein
MKDKILINDFYTIINPNQQTQFYKTRKFFMDVNKTTIIVLILNVFLVFGGFLTIKNILLYDVIINLVGIINFYRSLIYLILTVWHFKSSDLKFEDEDRSRRKLGFIFIRSIFKSLVYIFILKSLQFFDFNSFVQFFCVLLLFKAISNKILFKTYGMNTSNDNSDKINFSELLIIIVSFFFLLVNLIFEKKSEQMGNNITGLMFFLFFIFSSVIVNVIDHFE